MRYRNTVTGFEFDSECEIKGGNWVVVNDSPVPSHKEQEEKPKTAPKERKKK